MQALATSIQVSFIVTFSVKTTGIFRMNNGPCWNVDFFTYFNGNNSRQCEVTTSRLYDPAPAVSKYRQKLVSFDLNNTYLGCWTLIFLRTGLWMPKTTRVSCKFLLAKSSKYLNELITGETTTLMQSGESHQCRKYWKLIPWNDCEVLVVCKA